MTGTELIAHERQRQKALGWTEEHDRQHKDGAMVIAAVHYALPRNMCKDPPATAAQRIHDLAKAGALLAAEIDRLLTLLPEHDRKWAALRCAVTERSTGPVNWFLEESSGESGATYAPLGRCAPTGSWVASAAWVADYRRRSGLTATPGDAVAAFRGAVLDVTGRLAARGVPQSEELDVVACGLVDAYLVGASTPWTAEAIADLLAELIACSS